MINKEKEKKIKRTFYEFIKEYKIIIIITCSFAFVSLLILLVVSNLSKENKKCIVKFNSNGGTTINEQIINCGDKVTIPNIPIKEGFTFKYWSYDEEEFDLTKPIFKNVLLKAHYEKKDNIEVVMINFNTDGGSEIDSIEMTKGEKLVKPIDPSKEGYIFVGWFLNDTIFDFDLVVNNDITLTAKWKKESKNNNSSNLNDGDDNNCSYNFSNSLSGYQTLTIYDEFIPNMYMSNYNILLSYSNGCEIIYRSSNEKIAVVDHEGLITPKEEGTVKIYMCVIDKKTKKELECYTGNLKVERFKATYYENPTISYEDIKGRWYAKYSNISYIEFSNYFVDKSSNYQTVDYAINNIDSETLYYSCSTGVCSNDDISYRAAYGGIHLNKIENEYSMILKNGILKLNKNGKTIELTRSKSQVKVRSLSLKKCNLKIVVGERNCVKAYITPFNADNKEIILDYDKNVIKLEEVLQTTSNGEVINFYYTPIKSGSTTIKVTTKDGNYTESITINIEKPLVSVNGITLNKNNLEINVGKTSTLIASISPSEANNKRIYWSSSNKSVVTVDNNGLVKAINKGNAVITAKTEDGGYIASCSVTVLGPQLTATSSIGYKTMVSNSQILSGINVNVSATGGSGLYTYYNIKLYKDNSLISETTDSSKNFLFAPGFANGSYYAQIEVHDSDGNVYNDRSSIVTISGF